MSTGGDDEDPTDGRNPGLLPSPRQPPIMNASEVAGQSVKGSDIANSIGIADDTVPRAVSLRKVYTSLSKIRMEKGSDTPAALVEAKGVTGKPRKPRQPMGLSGGDKKESICDASPSQVAQESLTTLPETETTSQGAKLRKERRPVAKPNALAGLDGTGKLKAEITQLRRRYGSSFKHGPISAEGYEVSFDLPIVDPDFPFDVAALKLVVRFPPGYPEQGFATFVVVNDEIPENVRRRIQNRMDAASEGMPKGELNIKPLLRLLERSLEKWMVALPVIVPSSGTGAIKLICGRDVIVSAPCPTPAEPAPSVPIPTPRVSLDEVSRSLEMVRVGVPMKKGMAARTRFQPPEFLRWEPTPASAKAGTIMLELKGIKMKNIALAVPVQLGLALRCTRCRHINAITDVRSDVDRTISCGGCKQYMELAYMREAVHQHSCLVGYLRVKRTVPTDLLPCTFQLTCASCSPTDPLAASLKVEGVMVGEVIRYACRNCSLNCEFSYEGVAWNEIAAAVDTGSKTAAAVTKLPTKAGEPLPNYGTCEHYKKSCRWFRFPCCGRAYPCDECHAADPVNKNHVVEWASRQICGYCSREFSTAQKVCVCGEIPGATAKHTAHWEGGKGTRDQAAMSRKDRKKYRNQEKTVSARASRTK